MLFEHGIGQSQLVLQVKVAHARLPSVGFRSCSRFLAVSLQVTWVINSAVGCHYVPPGPQLPSQPLRGLLPISLLGKQRYDGCEQFVRTVTRQRRGCDLNRGPTAPESSMLTTRLPSHRFLHRIKLLYTKLCVKCVKMCKMTHLKFTVSLVDLPKGEPKPWYHWKCSSQSLML